MKFSKLKLFKLPRASAPNTHTHTLDNAFLKMGFRDHKKIVLKTEQVYYISQVPYARSAASFICQVNI